MIYEQCESNDDLRARLMTRDRPWLIAQQISNRGAIHALEWLKTEGVTAELVDSMLGSLREGLQTIHEVAHQRGIELPSYTE